MGIVSLQLNLYKLGDFVHIAVTLTTSQSHSVILPGTIMAKTSRKYKRNPSKFGLGIRIARRTENSVLFKTTNLGRLRKGYYWERKIPLIYDNNTQ